MLFTTSRKHILVLLRMGEIIARNMLSRLKLLIKLLLLHLIGCLYYGISDARLHKHQTEVNIYSLWVMHLQRSANSLVPNAATGQDPMPVTSNSVPHTSQTVSLRSVLRLTPNILHGQSCKYLSSHSAMLSWLKLWIIKLLLVHLFGCLHYYIKWCTVTKTSNITFKYVWMSHNADW